MGREFDWTDFKSNTPKKKTEKKKVTTTTETEAMQYGIKKKYMCNTIGKCQHILSFLNECDTRDC